MFPRTYTFGRYVPADLLTLKKALDIKLGGSSHVEAVSLLELTNEVIPERQHELAEKYSQYPGK